MKSIHACSMRAVEEHRPFRATFAEHPLAMALAVVNVSERLLDRANIPGRRGICNRVVMA